MAPSRGRHETWERRNYNGYPSANSRQVPRSGHCALGRRDVRDGFARRQQLRVSGFYTKCGRLGKRISSFDSIMSGPKNDSPDSVKQLEPQLGVPQEVPTSTRYAEDDVVAAAGRSSEPQRFVDSSCQTTVQSANKAVECKLHAIFEMIRALEARLELFQRTTAIFLKQLDG
ncbi:hypothetical protein HPB50_028894 [Hyalomma asiaticum]|nr:hypothetical protein HPB50_028894 [Hyalomma asiaticum]